MDDEELTLDDDETTGVVAVVSIVSEEPVTRRYLLSLTAFEVEFDELLFEDVNVEFEVTGLDTVFVALVWAEVGAFEVLITVEVDWITWMDPLLLLLSFFTFWEVSTFVESSILSFLTGSSCLRLVVLVVDETCD